MLMAAIVSMFVTHTNVLYSNFPKMDFCLLVSSYCFSTLFEPEFNQNGRLANSNSYSRYSLKVHNVNIPENFQDNFIRLSLLS